MAVPLLSAVDVHRQRGMIALLTGSELTLEPVLETHVSRVGENQLPAFVRNQIGTAVAHTYKYTDSTPGLTVRTVSPQRVQGKFDTQIDTLVSIGDSHAKRLVNDTVQRKVRFAVSTRVARPAERQRIWCYRAVDSLA